MQLDLLPNEKSFVAPSAPAKKTAALPEADLFSEEDKAPGAFKNISEAAASLGVPQHVLRFWESRFTQIKPMKRSGGRRYYRPEDMEILTKIKNLLYKQGYTIEGAKKAFGARKQAAQPKIAVKPALTSRQHSQLAVIRQELMGLRESLKPYII